LDKCSAYLAELWGVFGEFEVSRRYGFSKVEVHVDSKVVVENLNSDGDVGAARFQLV